MTEKMDELVKEREGVMQTEGTVNAKAQNGPFWNKNWAGQLGGARGGWADNTQTGAS